MNDAPETSICLHPTDRWVSAPNGTTCSACGAYRQYGGDWMRWFYDPTIASTPPKTKRGPNHTNPIVACACPDPTPPTTREERDEWRRVAQCPNDQGKMQISFSFHATDMLRLLDHIDRLEDGGAIANLDYGQKRIAALERELAAARERETQARREEREAVCRYLESIWGMNAAARVRDDMPEVLP